LSSRSPMAISSRDAVGRVVGRGVGRVHVAGSTEEDEGGSTAG
jgi:hypothetical protein